MVVTEMLLRALVRVELVGLGLVKTAPMMAALVEIRSQHLQAPRKAHLSRLVDKVDLVEEDLPSVVVVGAVDTPVAPVEMDLLVERGEGEVDPTMVAPTKATLKAFKQEMEQ